MKFLPFILKHLKRNWVRTLSTVLAMAICIFLFCTLQSVLAAVNGLLEASSANRLVTRHSRAVRTSSRTGRPARPSRNDTPANLSPPEAANWRERYSWSRRRTLTANQPWRANAGWAVAAWSTQTRIRGGSSETEVKALAVIPHGCPCSSRLVTTVTPAANRRNAARNSGWVTSVERTPDGARPSLAEVWRRFPKFVLGFVGASIVFSFIAAGSLEGEAIAAAATETSKALRGWCFCLAFVSIGLETNFRELSRFLAGGKPLVLYVCGQCLNLVLTLAMAWLMFVKVFPDAAASLAN